MAVKYWYKASNGSDNWSVVGNWYLGPGGTGGAAGLPTTADDVILNAASGTGTLTIAATATCNSLNASAFLGTLAGASALNIVTSSVASNNSNVLLLGVNHTYSGTITFTTSIGNTLNINCNDVFHKGNMTFNTVTGNWRGYNTTTSSYVPIRLTGLFTLTSGTIGNPVNSYETGNDIYAGTMASSNSNVRAFYINNAYLSGTGTLLTSTIQTNISFTVNNFYLTNTSATAKSISFSSNVYTANLYVQGSGASATTITSNANAQIHPQVYISKTEGTLIIGTSTFFILTFIEGSTIAWNSSNIVVLKVELNLTLCNSMSITSSNALTLGGQNGTFTTFNKTFTGTLRFDNGGFYFDDIIIIGDYISTFTGTAITVTNIKSVTFNGSVQLINGGINIAAVFFPTISFNSVSTPTTISIGTANVLLGSTSTGGALTLGNDSNLTFRQDSISSIYSFSTNNTTSRVITLNNAVINLIGVGTIWFISSTNLFFDAGTSTINIIDSSGSSVTFTGGGQTYYNLNINRTTLSNSPLTIITSNNNFQNFKDFTTVPPVTGINYIQFGNGSTTYIADTFQVGNSTSFTDLSSNSSVFNLIKANPGLVICTNLTITRSNASPSNTWYAINSSNGGSNTGWIFNIPSRRQGSLGVG